MKFIREIAVLLIVIVLFIIFLPIVILEFIFKSLGNVLGLITSFISNLVKKL